MSNLAFLVPALSDLAHQVTNQVADQIAPAFNDLALFKPEKPRWFDNVVLTRELYPETMKTLAMSGVSTLFTMLFGIPLGLLVVATDKHGLTPNAPVNKIVGFIVDLGRSIPFIILAVNLGPLTRLIVGTTLGWQAACVPLVIGATPFFARLVQSNIMGVDSGKIEAAQMMGASKQQIMWGVQVREAMPALVQSTTILIITIISYSAITGALGSGGVGFLATNYGYYQQMYDVAISTIVVIGVIVMVIQGIGDRIVRRLDHR